MGCALWFGDDALIDQYAGNFDVEDDSDVVVGIKTEHTIVQLV